MKDSKKLSILMITVFTVIALLIGCQIPVTDDQEDDESKLLKYQIAISSVSVDWSTYYIQLINPTNSSDLSADDFYYSKTSSGFKQGSFYNGYLYFIDSSAPGNLIKLNLLNNTDVISCNLEADYPQGLVKVGNYFYVSMQNDDKIKKVDVNTFLLDATYDVSTDNFPYFFKYSGSKVYLMIQDYIDWGNSDNYKQSKIQIFNNSDMSTIAKTITIGDSPNGMNPFDMIVNGNNIYVACKQGSITKIVNETTISHTTVDEGGYNQPINISKADSSIYIRVGDGAWPVNYKIYEFDDGSDDVGNEVSTGFENVYDMKDYDNKIFILGKDSSTNYYLVQLDSNFTEEKKIKIKAPLNDGDYQIIAITKP